MSANTSWIPSAPATLWSSPNDQFSAWPKLAVLALSTFVIHRLYKSASLTRKLPPGPRGWPILGSVFDIGPHMWLTFTEWKKQYGPIFYVNLAGRSMIVLNTHEAATELLDKRSSIYSDRPRHIVASEIMSGEYLLGFMHFDDKWKRVRRGSHEAMNNQITKTYRPFMQVEGYLLADSLMKAPSMWNDHIKRSAASFIMSVVYGTKSMRTSTDPTLITLHKFLRRSLGAAAGKYWVEFFHFLEHMPRWLAPWRVEAEEWFKTDSKMFEGFYNQVKKRMADGDNRPCTVTTLIEEQKKKNLSTMESVWLAAAMYGGGSESTAGSLGWWITAMVVYPSALRAAQEELDRVVGRDRMPTFDDYEHLPYCRAMVKEVLRWRPATPLGVPHRVEKDDWYNGYFIPKGTLVVANIWGMNHDEKVYGPDVHEFNPARFLESSGMPLPSVSDTKDEGHVTYGFGRRICVGRHIANNNLFIQFASMAWACNIQAKKDAQGRPIMPDADKCTSDLTMHTVPFDCDITPRFPEVPSIIGQTIELNNYGQI
ncbi:cytochrome P450 monooxygenase [Pleurotus pulmonarius]|nr:hypothetical protein EYR38_009972 [Pleurotus pulmonarius]